MYPAKRIFVTAALLAASAQAPAAERPAAETLAMGCAGCHGTAGRSHGILPPLAGRPEAEIIGILNDFKSGKRRSSIMNRIAAGYQNADFVAMAQYFSTR